jgi:post-segregation antitoxin (ccd killing protein)
MFRRDLETPMGKVELHLEVDAELLARAAEKGVRLDQALEEGIRAALRKPQRERAMTIVEAAEYRKRHPIDEEAAARQWAEENAAAIESHKKFIAEFGVFGDDLRTW